MSILTSTLSQHELKVTEPTHASSSLIGHVYVCNHSQKKRSAGKAEVFFFGSWCSQIQACMVLKS